MLAKKAALDSSAPRTAKNHCWMTPLLHPEPWRKCQVDFYDRVNLRLCTAWWNVMSLLQAQVESWAIDVDLFAVVRDILHTDVMYYRRALSRWGMLCVCFVSAPCRLKGSLPWHLAVAKSSGIAQRVWSQLSSLNWVATIQDNGEDSVDGGASNCGYSFCQLVCLEKFPLCELRGSWGGVGRVQFFHRNQKGLHFPYIAMTSCDDQMVSFWSILHVLKSCAFEQAWLLLHVVNWLQVLGLEATSMTRW